jgi:hypothetical protein
MWSHANDLIFMTSLVSSEAKLLIPAFREYQKSGVWGHLESLFELTHGTDDSFSSRFPQVAFLSEAGISSIWMVQPFGLYGAS